MSEQWHLLPVIRPVIAHRGGAVADGDRLGTVFPALRSDVLGGIRRADDQDVFVFELHRVAEVMGVQDAAFEGLKSIKLRHVRRAEMARADDDVVKSFCIGVILWQIADGHVELVAILFDPTHGSLKLDPITHGRFVHTALDIVEENGAGGIGRDLFAKVLLEGIVGKFKTFLRAIGPQVAVH